MAFTACTQDRIPFLRDAEIVSEMIAELSDHLDHHRCAAPIYCFMPDHLHLMIQGLEPFSRPKQVMDDFKKASGLWLAHNRPGLLWQEGYYDHWIRKSEDWKRQAFYILNNPVRKGLIADPYSYPFTGSIGYELEAMLADICW